MKVFNRALCAAGLAATLAGCATAYYSTMERFGVHKRDILVDNIEDARDSQEAAKEQFANALEEFIAVLNVDGGELEAKYRSLNNELERSEARANDVRKRIADVERVAKALFREWEDELDQYSNAELRRASERQLIETQRRYDTLIGAMRRAEAKLEPALIPFRDHVLFLKHNLNAQAVASLQDELVVIESDVGALIREMEAAIAEADAFIQDMK